MYHSVQETLEKHSKCLIIYIHRKEFSKNCNKCLTQQFEFARELIAPKPKGQLQSSKEAVETHLKKSLAIQKEKKKELSQMICHSKRN